ncbi:MAG TPA: response regulator [bacterium]|nr:response regulator [bacterium]
MTPQSQLIPILMADDDADDKMLAAKALKENRVANPLVTVSDGEELLQYLHRSGPYRDAARPCFILLDLNMPRLDGREALKIIKGDPELRKIPVVILTTSRAEEDIVRGYNLGANSYITKPVTFEGLVGVMSTLKTYWLEIVELPDGDPLANP